jgi:hypothetical protein
MTAEPCVAELPHGYTLRDLDAMARAACAADRSLSSDMATRYQVAWSAIALALVEAPHWPRRESLVRAGWMAIYAELREMQHTFGVSRDADRGAVASGQRFREYWWHGTVDFEDGLVERLAVGPCLGTLTDAEREAVTALAVHDDYRAAAEYLGLRQKAFQARIDAARRRFMRRWYYPETPPQTRHTDRRVEAYGKERSATCHRGHEWTPENTRWRRDGRRTCRACEKARKARDVCKTSRRMDAMA